MFEFNVRALKQSVREFYGRASLFVAPKSLKKGETAVYGYKRLSSCNRHLGNCPKIHLKVFPIHFSNRLSDLFFRRCNLNVSYSSCFSFSESSSRNRKNQKQSGVVAVDSSVSPLFGLFSTVQRTETALPYGFWVLGFFLLPV